MIEATTDQCLLIEAGSLHTFDGDLNDYRAHRLAQENVVAAPAVSSQSQKRKDMKRIEAQIRQEKAKRSKPIQQKIERAEKEMAALQAQQAQCDEFLSQECAYLPENKAKLQEILAQATEVKVKLTGLEENWLQWQEDLETVNSEIDEEFQSLLEEK